MPLFYEFQAPRNSFGAILAVEEYHGKRRPENADLAPLPPGPGPWARPPGRRDGHLQHDAVLCRAGAARGAACCAARACAARSLGSVWARVRQERAPPAAGREPKGGAHAVSPALHVDTGRNPGQSIHSWRSHTHDARTGKAGMAEQATCAQALHQPSLCCSGGACCASQAHVAAARIAWATAAPHLQRTPGGRTPQAAPQAGRAEAAFDSK